MNYPLSRVNRLFTSPNFSYYMRCDNKMKFSNSFFFYSSYHFTSRNLERNIACMNYSLLSPRTENIISSNFAFKRFISDSSLDINLHRPFLFDSKNSNSKMTHASYNSIIFNDTKQLLLQKRNFNIPHNISIYKSNPDNYHNFCFYKQNIHKNDLSKNNYTSFILIKRCLQYRNQKKEKNDLNTQFLNDIAKDYKFGWHYISISIAACIMAFTCGFCLIPLYRLFCQTGNFAGRSKEVDNIIGVKPIPGKEILVNFNKIVQTDLPWEFTPLQDKMTVTVGETALAFYRATNTCDVPITGISSYAIIPYTISKYFVKIQCFCFEEQRLEPGETVDMPLFFYIDPSVVDSGILSEYREATLSYIFYKSKNSDYYESLRNNPNIPLPKVS